MALNFTLLRPFALLRDARDAAALLDKEEFLVPTRNTLASGVCLALGRLDEARSNAFKNRQRYITAEDRLREVVAERDALKAKVERMTGGLKQYRGAPPTVDAG